jgi:Domain of unknown function (DUF4386)
VGDKMNTNRTTAKIVGALFLVATVTYMVGNGLIAPILNTQDYLNQIQSNRTQLMLGVLIKFAAATTNFSIGVLLFPILNKFSETVAVGYVVTRICDGAGVAINAMSTLLLLTLSQETMAAQNLALGNLIIAGSNTIFFVTMAALGIGSIPFCYLLYRTGLIPRPMAALGIVGYISLLLGSLCDIYGINLNMIHYAPGGIFELILPIWLLTKGFNTSEAIS